MNKETTVKMRGDYVLLRADYADSIADDDPLQPQELISRARQPSDSRPSRSASPLITVASIPM